MSGHNKWSKIKHKKAAKDAKRGNLFTKLAKEITLAASEGGGDPDMNFTLRLAMDKAKQANMPNDNIDRAIKKGTGGLKGEEIVRISYEAYVAGGAAMIIDCSTDNTNRTLAEIKLIVDTSGGKMAKTGAVSYQFEEKGHIQLAPMKLKKSEKFGKEDTYENYDLDEMEMEVLEIDGVEDIERTDVQVSDESDSIEGLDVVTERNSFAEVDKKIREIGFKIISSQFAKLANDTVEISDNDVDKITKLVENLEELDDVDNIWVNI